jgi:hypothetical protein
MESSRFFFAETSLRMAAISAAASGVSCPRNAALARTSAAVRGAALAAAGFATTAAGCAVEMAGAAPGEYTAAGFAGVCADASPAGTLLTPFVVYAVGTGAGPTGNRCTGAMSATVSVTVGIAGCPRSVDESALGAAAGTDGALAFGTAGDPDFGMMRNITIPAPATMSAAHAATMM